MDDKSVDKTRTDQTNHTRNERKKDEIYPCVYPPRLVSSSSHSRTLAPTRIMRTLPLTIILASVARRKRLFNIISRAFFFIVYSLVCLSVEPGDPFPIRRYNAKSLASVLLWNSIDLDDPNDDLPSFSTDSNERRKDPVENTTMSLRKITVTIEHEETHNEQSLPLMSTILPASSISRNKYVWPSRLIDLGTMIGAFLFTVWSRSIDGNFKLFIAMRFAIGMNLMVATWAKVGISMQSPFLPIANERWARSPCTPSIRKQQVNGRIHCN